MQTRDVQPSGIRFDKNRGDLVQAQPSSVHDLSSDRAPLEQLRWNKAACVQAHRARSDDPLRADSDQICRTGTRTDEMNGHCVDSSGVSVSAPCRRLTFCDGPLDHRKLRSPNVERSQRLGALHLKASQRPTVATHPAEQQRFGLGGHGVRDQTTTHAQLPPARFEHPRLRDAAADEHRIGTSDFVRKRLRRGPFHVQRGHAEIERIDTDLRHAARHLLECCCSATWMSPHPLDGDGSRPTAHVPEVFSRRRGKRAQRQRTDLLLGHLTVADKSSIR